MRFPFVRSPLFRLRDRSPAKLSLLFFAAALSSSLFALRPALAGPDGDGSLFDVPGEGPPYVSRYSARTGWPPFPTRRTNVFRNSSFEHQVERPIYEYDLPNKGPYKAPRRPAKRYAEDDGAHGSEDFEYRDFAPHRRSKKAYLHDEGKEPDDHDRHARENHEHKGEDEDAYQGEHASKGEAAYEGGDAPQGHGFGRLFPKGRTPYDLAALEALGRAMVEEGKPGGYEGDSETPAGYTFLGQFIDHDITFDTTTQLGLEIKGDHLLENARTPELDLDSVYGGGPARTPHLYRVPYIRVGRLISGDEDTPRADLFRTKSARYYGPVGGEAVALVGDPRNDENIIVSQIHAAFVAFHNRTVDILVERDFGRDRWAFCKSGAGCDTHELAEALPGDVKTKIFGIAHDHVIHYYHRMIVEDFLPWVIGYERTVALLKHGRDFFYPEGFRDKHGHIRKLAIPVEFAAAAFRYGHSQVRDAYQLSERGVFDLLTDGKGGSPRAFQPVTPRFLIDWRYFFDIDPKRPEYFNYARRIDPELVRSLHRLHISNAVGKQDVSSLAARNLVRGKTLHLPSGQEVAELILPVLQQRGLLGEKGYGPRAGKYDESWRSYILPPDERVRYFLGKWDTPLWYYVLQEASVFGGNGGLHSSEKYEDEYVSGGDYGPYRERGTFRRASVKHGRGRAHRDYDDHRRGGGTQLGPVGGTIVGEVLTGLLDHYRERTGKGLAYEPQINGSLSHGAGAYGKGGGKGRYLMRNFLIDAGVADGE